jgi:hypothetical protein
LVGSVALVVVGGCVAGSDLAVGTAILLRANVFRVGCCELYCGITVFMKPSTLQPRGTHPSLVPTLPPKCHGSVGWIRLPLLNAVGALPLQGRRSF